MPGLRRQWLLFPSILALSVVVWGLWPSPSTTRSPADPVVPDGEFAAPLLVVAVPSPPTNPSNEPRARSAGAESKLDWRDPATRKRLFEAARHHCPWPPHPTSWARLDGPCEAALNRFYLTEDWRRALDDPLGDRYAAAEALRNRECRPHASDPQRTSWREWPRWRGESRPDLYAQCAADAIVRVADLQHKCVERLHMDWNSIYEQSVRDVDDIAAAHSYDQGRYYRLVEDDHHRRVSGYWKNHMCRSVPPGVFDWLDAFPEPPGDPAAHRYNRPPITQSLHLYDAARRLGAEVPRWALPPDHP